MFRLLNQLLLLIYFGGNIWNKPFVCLIFAIVNNHPIEYISIQGGMWLYGHPEKWKKPMINGYSIGVHEENNLTFNF
jgi:hypothetical protein